MKTNHYFLGLALLVAGAMPAFSQVSNNNEDGVNKVDARFARDYVHGQVLVKFKDESAIRVQNNANGGFRAASINSVDELLKEYDVVEMEKLFPTAEQKPSSQLRSRRAPNGTIVKERNLDKVFLLKMGEDKPVLELIEKLKAMPDVEYAEPNYRVYFTADVPAGYGTMDPTQQQSVRRAPVTTETTASVICSKPSNNPLYFRQYGITQQNIHQLWNKQIKNKKRPVIAILDTGIDITHPDLADNIWTNTAEVEGETAYDDDGNGIVDDKYGWNFIDDYGDLTDRNGHGTHVAGIAAAADNNIGIVGANPLALIMPVKVMNDRGEGDQATIARGIAYAVANGADILNMSFGSAVLSNSLKDALDNAYQAGTILVASAGNYGLDIYNPYGGTCYPAAYYLVLGVEASASNLQRASFSNYDPDGPIYSEDGIDGRNYEIQVSGDKVYSTLPGGKYNQLSGTSMSAPLLAGAISALQMVKDYPSNDILFGDLIHLEADFAKIYSEDTPRMPKLELVALNIDDNVNGNTNIDGQVDAGETIKFYPVLRNTWADATDISIGLTVDNVYSGFVEISDPQVPFGYSISAYGQETAQTPIIVQFTNNIGNNTRVKFQLTITCAQSNEAITKDVYVTVNNMVKIGGMITADKRLTADYEWLVTSNIAIPQGVTLTIDPGTTVRFNENTGISNSGTLVADGTPENPILMIPNQLGYWNGVNRATLRYCKIQNVKLNYEIQTQGYYSYENCILDNYTEQYPLLVNLLNKSNLVNGNFTSGWYDNNHTTNTNIVNNNVTDLYAGYFVSNLNSTNNWINSYTAETWMLGKESTSVEIVKPNDMAYYGTSKEDILRKYIYEIDNDVSVHPILGPKTTYAWFDLTNMKTVPNTNAHGIVWKVVVNGKDAQDEYENLAPLGVSKHKFEVYFNRPMNKAVTPKISFGVREPYTQHVVDEGGEGSGWNEEGTIYTAYKTINGRTQSDGVNRIYVQGAEDNEYFECPYEKTRFNINIQATGSMATGFAGEAKMGRVELTWNNDDNDFDDAMGFNIYRYQLDNDNNEVNNTCINKEIVDIETTEYTDYDVVPGQTYYYMYKVLSTDLKEYDVSNVVAVTPLTSELGDANGSGDVDVADVITTVNYAAGMEPKPFIFEAADMNADLSIDILDVVGIIQKILNPTAAPVMAMAETIATYTIEDGVLYVESPIALAGIQVQLNLPEKKDMTVADGLNGFEQTSAWLSDNDYLFLAYNMNGKTLPAGKHALLNIGDAEISNIRLSDTMGGNVNVEGGQGTTSIDAMGSKVQLQDGVFNLKGQKVASNAADLQRLPKGVYIINGEKVVK